MRIPVSKGRTAGPETTRQAAKKLVSVNAKTVYQRLKKLGKATADGVIESLDNDMPPGKKIRVDPISGMFNQLCMLGFIATTGRKEKNSSGQQAMLWRRTKPEEKKFLREYVGSDIRNPWPSPDSLLDLPEVKKVLEEHNSKRVRRLYRRYRKGRLFKTVFKDKGIVYFMKRYDTKGRKLDDG